MRWNFIITLIVIIFLIVACAVYIPSLKGWQTRNGAEAMSNLYAIRIALERYGVDHNALYPEDISTIIKEEYLNEFPINPYTKEQMKNIELGSEPELGEFTYVPLYQNGEVRSYYLFIYGDVYCPNDFKYLDEYGFKGLLFYIGRSSSGDSTPPPIEDVFLKGASVPTLLDKWKKPAEEKSDE